MASLARAAFLLAGLVFVGSLTAVTIDDARELYRAKRYAEARAAFEAVAAAEPDNADAAYHLGQLALMRDDEQEAVKRLKQATALRPKWAPYLRALGDAYGLSAQKAGIFSKLGLARKSEAAYEEAVALDPGNIDARYSLFSFYRQAPALAGGGMDKARAEALKIKKLDDVRGTIALVEVSLAEKKYDEAFAALELLRRNHPESAVAAYQIGRVAAVSGLRLDQGAAMLKDYLTRPPGDGQPPLWAAHWRLGQIDEKQGDLAGARAEFQAGLKLNPTQPQLVEALQRVQ